VILLCWAVPAVAWSQDRHLSQEIGLVEPWRFRTTAASVRGSRATPADVKAIESSVKRLASLILAAPLLNPPKGFQAFLAGALIEPDYLQAKSRGPAGMPLAVSMRFGAGAYYVDANSTGPAGTPPKRRIATQINQIDFLINSISPVTLDHIGATRWEDTQGEFYLEPPVTGQVAGFPLYKDLMVIARRGESIWAPVSQERFLKVWIEDLRSGTTSAALRTSTLKSVEERLASLSATERKAPVCVIPPKEPVRWQMTLAPMGTPGCRRIVEANIEMFNPKLPRSAIQLITVEGIQECRELVAAGDKKATGPGDCTVNLELVRQMDWQRAAALLEK